jgi:hypothetical protein
MKFCDTFGPKIQNLVILSATDFSEIYLIKVE